MSRSKDKEKERRYENEGRGRNVDESADEEKDIGRSSKRSRDANGTKGHASSSRKRDRSIEREGNGKEHRDRSRDRHRDKDGEEVDTDEGRKKRRREDGDHKERKSGHKSKHRDRDRKDKDKDKDRDRREHNRKDDDRHKHRGNDGSKSSRDKDKEKSKHRGKESRTDDTTLNIANKTSNGVQSKTSAVNGSSSLSQVAFADGEEEGELVMEPPKVSGTPATSETSKEGDKPSDGVSDSQVSVAPPESDEQAEEAARVAAIAARAEQRAVERARARSAAATATGAPTIEKTANKGEPSESSKSDARVEKNGGRSGVGARGSLGSRTGAEENVTPPSKPTFKTKKQREQEALRRLEEQHQAKRKAQEEAAAERGMSERQKQQEAERQRQKEREEERAEARARREKEKELEELRNQYLGKKKQKKKIVKPSEKFSKIFQFDWDANEDTSRDTNPLYSQRAQLNASFGRGYLAGIDMREQRKDSAFLTALMRKRQEEQRRAEEADKSLSAKDKMEREQARERQLAEVAAFSREEAEGLGDDPARRGAHWSEKPLEEMGERDWRIFREDFDIRVKGGKAPLPLRFWTEANLAGSIMEAITDLGYEKPSPIQRQAIPIGMERRDIIGIAETGSGKTAAFGIPMISYILSLDASMRDRVADQGPLALIMAPTRELAIQIEEECIKFCKYAGLKTVCVVGGQDIEAQAFTLRRGVEIIIGTPGRLNDCVEKHYLVLNQCNYVVLDEADRMIDMGFEEQVLAVLDAMGGTLKADDEQQAYLQEKKAKSARNSKDLVRVTAMFSATMPPAVEKMAKKYLRHPAVVQIGDEDTGKNRRIEQRVLWLTEAQKKTKVVELLRYHNKNDRVLVFINTKKSADMLGRQLEQAGFPTGVLHGGKTQDQREENLEMFRDGTYTVLVATDVASRGLDIPDVKEVINYELPNKIETYSHRIGRTGRAGKDGVATSFLTEHDEEIMFALKEYLVSTGSQVPQQLMRHNAAQAAVGTRRDDGSLVNSKRDTVMFAKK